MIYKSNRNRSAALTCAKRSVGEPDFPGVPFIEEVEHLQDGETRWEQVKCVGVGHGNHVVHQLLRLSNNLRVPCLEFLVELFRKLGHGGTIPPLR